ncbi:aminotransferase class I/II-fold pyridoxal phosphate-dependent enzyme [Candidatus Calescamantes bacterium]|nr:aminotransferase class I/II-fold pyridoxal phosphate-dependent enzyme [Candidatus Calescamantes bacterium]
MQIMESSRIRNLPPYIFSRVNTLKYEARLRGEDVIDLGMGNPDSPPPHHVINKLIETVKDPKVHRYSASKGIKGLRKAICEWYERKFSVTLDEEEEVVVLIGSKEGISHLFLSIMEEGEGVIVPTPTYPSHFYASAIAGTNVITIQLFPLDKLLERVKKIMHEVFPSPKVLILSFPHNPTTVVVKKDFFQEVVLLAKQENLLIVHDFAYAEICFDGYQAPSFLQVPGAKEVGIELYSLSKTYSMAGWRVGFACGKKEVIQALTKLKSYYDYGIFTPIQVAAISALRGPQNYVQEIRDMYSSRRDTLIKGLRSIGWKIQKPQATMYVWAKIPDEFSQMGSLDFSLHLLKEAKVAVSPGIGFGEEGEGYVRFALVENEHRIRQAIRNMRRMMRCTSQKG